MGGEWIYTRRSSGGEAFINVKIQDKRKERRKAEEDVRKESLNKENCFEEQW